MEHGEEQCKWRAHFGQRVRGRNIQGKCRNYKQHPWLVSFYRMAGAGLISHPSDGAQACLISGFPRRVSLTDRNLRISFLPLGMGHHPKLNI